MSSLIQEYYHNKGIPSVLAKRKEKMMEDNPDIASEFEYWLKNGKYVDNDPVTVEEYTAEKLSKLSKYLKSDDAFILLIELRENPEKAKERIQTQLLNR